MPKTFKKITILALAAVLLAANLVLVPECRGITIQEERELAREFMAVVKARYRLIDDPVIVDYVNRVGHHILAVLPPQPFDYRFFVIHEEVYNAFATPGGNIFINSGLLAALDSEEELAGILAHEIAHVVSRHISERIESSKKIGMATLAGMVAGALLGAGGGGAAASAVTIGSVAAGQTLALAYSRENEIQADQLGLNYMIAAGYSGKGLLTSLQKIRSKQWFGSEQIPTYLNTHPASESRMSYIDNWLHQNRPVEGQPRAQVGGFKRAHTRLVALYTNPQVALTRFQAALAASPDDPLAHYGTALALTRVDRWREAAGHMQRAVEANAMDTHMLQDLGRIYFQGGDYEKAMGILSSAGMAGHPQARLYLARTQLGLGRIADARKTLEQLVRDHEGFTEAYFFLGQSSGQLGDLFGAHYHLGRYYRLTGDLRNADFHLNRALGLAVDEAQRREVTRQLEIMSPKTRQRPNPG